MRILEEHIVITDHLSKLEFNSLWWIGATDASPISPEEGKFVWITTRMDITSQLDWKFAKPKSNRLHYSYNSSSSLWGPGQPDNWPNQVIFFICHYKERDRINISFSSVFIYQHSFEIAIFSGQISERTRRLCRLFLESKQQQSISLVME